MTDNVLHLRQETAKDTPAAPAARTHRHIPALDGVRGVAVLSVFLMHYGGGAKSANPVLHFAGVMTQAGWIGVTFFFILSGFLITGILWDTRSATSALRNFYIRRVLRIFPLYYACLLLVVIFAAMGGSFREAASNVYVYALYLQNVPLPHGSGGAPNLSSPLELSHLWSLAVEEHFYLLWPALVLRLRTFRQARWLALGVFLASAIFRVVAWYLLPAPDHAFGTAGYRVFHGAYGFTVSRAGELAAGAWLAICYREPERWRRISRMAPYLCAAGLTGYLLSSWQARSLSVESASVFMVGLPCVTLMLSALLVLALGDGRTGRIMTLRPLQWLGGVSYGFYIFHVLFTRQFLLITGWLVHSTTGPVALGANFFVALALSLLLAWLSFRFFETPFLRLRWRFRAENQPV